jgi:uncharacterized membrane protein
MRHVWNGLVATFLSGLFAILPLVITVAIISWVAEKVYGLIEPGTKIGDGLRSVGMWFQFVTNETAATVVGCLFVVIGIWAFGLLVKTKAKATFENVMNAIVNRIPFVKGVYGTAQQVIGMLDKSDEDEFSSMSAVFCDFGENQGAGFLALLASNQMFRFNGRNYRVVYIPTSPLPMSGGIIFVPVESVKRVEMSPDQLMQIYLSLGVLSPQVVPQPYHAPAPSAAPGT